MKSVYFEYERPKTLPDAVKLLTNSDGQAKVLAGGQSLGAMMNLRLARPSLLVDIRHIPEMTQVTHSGNCIVYGACTTHASIEDGKVADASNNMMPTVAAGIAYRAVRNRGTIGGSLVHADPAADWVITLTLLGAMLELAGPNGRRQLAMEDFMNSAFDVVMDDDEILVSIHVPKLSRDARWGYYKSCRKAGEFPEGMSATIDDPEHGIKRVVIGATDTRPLIIGDAAALFSDPSTAAAVVKECNISVDFYLQRIHAVCLKRAIEQII